MAADDEFNSMMLTALTNEAVPDVVFTTVPIPEQISYLMRWIDTLSIDDKKAIGNVLTTNGLHDKLLPCAQGTVINLDKLSAEVLTQMYSLMVHKREPAK